MEQLVEQFGTYELQWGRAHVSAESSVARRTGESRIANFNGAALT